MTGLRVISGAARGRRLRQVSGYETRPISGKVKGALFNIIGGDVKGAAMLDLFGGTGSVGVEALSRGAAWTLFLDTRREAIQTIRTNLEMTGLQDRAEVVQADALQYLERDPVRAFDYVYIAPPQYRGLWSDTLQHVDNCPSWLSLDGWVIVQIHPSEFSEIDLKRLAMFDRRRYGNTMLCFFR